jgi:hypothetical protein
VVAQALAAGCGSSHNHILAIFEGINSLGLVAIKRPESPVFYGALEGWVKGVPQSAAGCLSGRYILDVDYLLLIPSGPLEAVQEGGGVHKDFSSHTGDHFHLIVQKLNVARSLLNVTHNLGKDFISMATVVADAGDAQGQPLPEVVIFHLSDGDVEPATYSGGYGLGHLPLALKALVPRQP